MEGIEQIKESINAILARLDRTDDGLWDAEDIGRYARLGKRTIQVHYIGRPDFPRPVSLVTGGRRWNSQEVKEWFNRRR